MAKLNYYKPEPIWLVFQQHNMTGQTLWEKIERFILNRLKPGFSHVYTIKKGSEGNFIIIDAYSDSMAIYEVKRPNYIEELKLNGCTIIETRTQDCSVHPRGLITCVSIAKYILGIRKVGILTPWQLYKFLTKE